MLFRWHSPRIACTSQAILKHRKLKENHIVQAQRLEDLGAQERAELLPETRAIRAVTLA